MAETLTLPRWIFGRPGHYLVAVRPDGTASIDGDHSDPSGVAHARELFEALRVIRPPAGTEYVMVTVGPVPQNTRPVNDEAVQTLNAITPAPAGEVDRA